MAGSGSVKVLDRPDPTALGEIVSAELSKQIETAKNYPRDTEKGLRELEQLSTRSDAVAESCMYTLKRTEKGGKIVWITGPSVRFAELLAYCWGNLRWGARITDEGAKAVVAQGLAYDLERNTGGLVEIRRGIVTSTGNRYGQDMINVTSNAACSIATRNAIFDVIPQVLWWDAYEIVKEKALAAAAIPEKLQNAIAFFVQKGAKEDEILTAMGVKSITDMGRDHLEIFIGLRTALKAGTLPIDRMFHPDAAAEREKLSLVADEDGDHYNSIDGQLKGAAPTDGKKAAPKGGPKSSGGMKSSREDTSGGSPKTAAPKGSGQQAESPTPASEDADKGKTATAKAGAGSADDPTDEQVVAGVEAAEKKAKSADKGNAIKAAKGALRMISETGEDAALKARADALLNKYDLED